MKTTIHSIAEILNVSPTTVSMALNGSPRVAEKTRIRVREFAAQCDFVPSESARNLRLKKSSLVAVVVYDISSNFWSGAVSAIEAALGDVYSVILCNSYGSLENEKRIIQTLRLRQIAGLIITPASTEIDHLQQLNKQGTPVVLFERVKDHSLSFVKGDDVQSTIDTVEMCLKDGHRNIALLTSKTQIVGIADRMEAFNSTVAQAGVADSCQTFVLENGGMQCITENFLPVAGRFSVVLCMEDEVAAALLSVLNYSGVRVPEDLSVISWNNSSYLDYLTPPLTSIRIPVREMGTAAAKIVLAYHDGNRGTKQHLLQEEIVFRKSYKRLNS